MSDVSLVITVSNTKGQINFKMFGPSDSEVISMNWVYHGGSTGFQVQDRFIRLTEVAAEYFIRIFIALLSDYHSIDEGSIEIVDERGEVVKDIKFLPPTFDGNINDIDALIAKRIMLNGALFNWESDGRPLNAALLGQWQSINILEDILNIIEILLSRFNVKLKTLTQEQV